MPRTALLVRLTFLLLSTGLWSQEAAHPKNPGMLARLAYNGSSAVQDGGRDICLAVSQDGSYRVLLSMKEAEPLRLKGKMPPEQLQKLKILLWSDEFRALSGNHGGLIRQESQNFRAEVPRDSETQRLQWLNADGENPFPAPVEKVVAWLNRFQPASGEWFEPAEFPDVCPSVGLSRVQPTLAESNRP